MMDPLFLMLTGGLVLMIVIGFIITREAKRGGDK